MTPLPPERLKRISKRLALHLRHDPGGLGLSLEPGGWVEVEALLEAFSRKYFPLSREALEQVVRENDKQRFAFDESGDRIRANQGHSVPVDLQLEPQTPPEVLYHGTARHNLEQVLASGLKRMSRHHVHLSQDEETALKVGTRHGKPVLLRVRAREMHEAGHLFYRSANGVWLVDEVPPQWLEVL